MDAAIAGALIGFIGTAIGTLGSQALTLARERQREQYQRQVQTTRDAKEQAEELRSLFDGATYQLRTAMYAMEQLIMLVAPLRSGGLLEGPPLGWVHQFQEKIVGTVIAESKLAVRLPEDDPAVELLSVATDVLERAAEATLLWGQGEMDATTLVEKLSEHRVHLENVEGSFRAAIREAVHGVGQL